ncbi:MAG: YlbF family regulator [Oscillospiraceae bacterium]|nr:YlbF family regulator [Candidatus Equicaccousia limihippi]
MDTLQKAREMCASLQEDEAYIAFKKAKEENDNDMELQTLIGEFNLIRMSMDKALSET